MGEPPPASDRLLGADHTALDSHAGSTTTSTVPPHRRKLRRDARPKSSKHSPLLRDLSMRSLSRNINQSSPAPSSIYTEFFTPDSISVPPMLSPPDSFYHMERILHLVRTYASGFGAGSWPLHCLSAHAFTSDDNFETIQRSLNAMNGFYSLHLAAHGMLQSPSSGSLSGACDLADRALDNFRPMIEGQHHNTLVQLFSVIVLFDSPGPHFDYLQSGLDFFSQMATTVLSRDHPITAMIRALLTVGEPPISNAIALAWEVLAVSFEQNLGVAHHVSLNCRLRMIELVYIKPGKLQDAEMLLAKLSDTVTTGCGPQDLNSISIEYSLARVLLHQGQYAKCSEVASRVINRCWDAQTTDAYAAAALESAALQLMATAHCRMGQYLLAESSLRQYVQIRLLKWGWQSPLHLQALLSLEEFLTAIHKMREAADVKQQRLYIMAQPED